MGLISAALSAASSTLSQQWKEYFYCEALPFDVLAVKGKKRQSGVSSNRDDNIISSGSVIAVADGQCALIVDQGKVVEFCAEPGEFVYDSSTEPSFFGGGSFGDNVKEIFLHMGKSFTFGGETPKDQRVYYINTKEIIGNKYGTPAKVPFLVIDPNINLRMNVNVSCFGEYSYKITNPILFYTNVCNNFSGVFTRDTIDGQLKSELLSALQPAFAKVSAQGIEYSQLPAYTTQFGDALKAELSQKWSEFRGIELMNIGVSSIKADEADEATIKELQRNAVFKDPSMAAAQWVGATSNAIQDAAKNEGGAAVGFMGYNMVNQAAGVNPAALYNMGAAAGQPAAQPVGWNCTKCGTLNQGKFCTNCGTPKPEEAPQYKCNNCGWVPSDPNNLPKFCPNCGDPFNEEDIVR
ncbi:MAG: SPFH domain-containing protein [Oscillospiraceae bacterium]|nr:SPFH domain-containing protein [Oscillospiraceae bacterium]